jgi:hypothetical protein
VIDDDAYTGDSSMASVIAFNRLVLSGRCPTASMMILRRLARALSDGFIGGSVCSEQQRDWVDQGLLGGNFVRQLLPSRAFGP